MSLLLLLRNPAPTSAVFQSSSSSSASSFLNNGTNITLPAGTAAGDLLIVEWSVDITSGTVTGSGWTLIGESLITAPDGQYLGVFGRIATGSDPVAFTCNTVTAQASWICSRFSGGNLVVPASNKIQFSSNTTNNASPITVTATGVTALQADTLLVGTTLDIIAQTDTWSFSTLSGFTQIATVNNQDWNSSNKQYQSNVAAGATGNFVVTATQASGTSGAGWIAFVLMIAGSSSTLDPVKSYPAFLLSMI